MADIKYIVECDATGALKSIKDLDVALGGSAAQADKDGKAFGGLAGQFALGAIAADLVMKAARGLVGAIGSCITGAIEEEKAEKSLEAALSITGRTVAGNKQHYMDFAMAQMSCTTYTHEQVQESQALLLQLTRLDQQGIDRATKGAMGLATTMGMDLHGATMMVTKAMEGNYTALGRVGIRVSENMTAEEKQAYVLDRLEKLYGRSTAEVNTFGGAVKQMGNMWGEAKEAIGGALVKSEGAKELIKTINRIITEATPEIEEYAKQLAGFISAVAKVIEGSLSLIEQLKQKIGGLRSYLSDEEKAWNTLNQAMGGYSTIAGDIIARMKAQGASAKELEDVAATLDKAWQDFGGNTVETLKAILAGNYGPKIKAAFEVVGGAGIGVVASFQKVKGAINEVGTATHTLTADEIKAAAAKKKLGDAAQELLGKYSPLLGEMMKLKAEEDTLTKARKAGTMSAGAYDKAMAANAKAMRDVGLEAGKSAKAQGEIAKAASDIINKYNPMHAAMVKAIDDEKKLTTALKAGVITDKDYAKGLESIKKDLAASAEEARKAKIPVNAFASAIQDIVNKVHPMRAAMLQAIASEKAATLAYKAGILTLKEYKKALEEIGKELANSQPQKKWVTTTINAVDAITQAATAYYSYLDGRAEQSLTKKLSALETEYQAQVTLIANSKMNEDEKTAAMLALDKEYNEKRKALEKQSATERKKIAIAMAIINVAEGVTKALSSMPPPFNIILAAITAAAGALQIALIKSQPIGAAKGAIFKQKALLMSQASGQEYEVAEGGEAEIVSSPRQLREAIMGRGAAGGRGNPINITFNIHALDGADVEETVRRKVAPLLQRMMKSELFLIHPRAVRTY